MVLASISELGWSTEFELTLERDALVELEEERQEEGLIGFDGDLKVSLLDGSDEHIEVARV